jgi:glycosyltransferase involved in cell wall biosynthesis
MTNEIISGGVSVIIPVYNRPRQLRDAVLSAARQSLRPLEILVVDDGSTDETASIAQELASDFSPLIRVIRQPNGGPGLAREAGRQAALGEYLQYLDSDDVLYARKFELQIAALAEAPSSAACYGPVRYRYADGKLADDPIKLTGRVIPRMFPSFLADRWWSTHAPLWRRKVTDEAGPWTDLRIHEDWEYDCRIAASGATLCCVGEDVAEVRQSLEGHGKRFDRNKLRDRARAHELIFGHAKADGIALDCRESLAFSNASFLLCRECAAVGLLAEAQTLWKITCDSAPPIWSKQFPRKVFGALSRGFGFRVAGLVSLLAEKGHNPRRRV